MNPIMPSPSHAAELEGRGQWEDALQIYFHLLQADKLNTEYREKLQKCFRHVLQARRHRDLSFQHRVASLTVAQSSSLLEEVLEKIQSLYVDRDRSEVNRLFHAGLEEFLNALDHPDFRKQHLKSRSHAQIHRFRNLLQDQWQGRSIRSTREAKLAATSIARQTQQELGIQTSMVLLEFICGACNSLDEYSAYLTPADLDEEEPAGEKSVVDAAVVQEGVAYLKVERFQDSTPVELDEAMNRFKMTMEGRNLRGLILDLRGNSGGNFEAAVRFAEKFLNRGVIATTTGPTAEANKIFSPTPGASILDIGLIVLVDAKTASAAEVVAHALRDQQRAKIVGMPTFGKGTIQNVLEFRNPKFGGTGDRRKPSPGALRITLARVFSPSGQAISGGLMPHIIAASREQQLALAVQEAGNFPTVMQQ